MGKENELKCSVCGVPQELLPKLSKAGIICGLGENCFYGADVTTIQNATVDQLTGVVGLKNALEIKSYVPRSNSISSLIQEEDLFFNLKEHEEIIKFFISIGIEYTWIQDFARLKSIFDLVPQYKNKIKQSENIDLENIELKMTEMRESFLNLRELEVSEENKIKRVTDLLEQTTESDWYIDLEEFLEDLEP